jgi:hypothetical protein
MLLVKNSWRGKKSRRLQLLLLLLVSCRWRLLASRLTAGLLHDLLQKGLGGQDVCEWSVRDGGGPTVWRRIFSEGELVKSEVGLKPVGDDWP